jgi:hypothetical protein
MDFVDCGVGGLASLRTGIPRRLTKFPSIFVPLLLLLSLSLSSSVSYVLDVARSRVARLV